jgi:hypothetical protein
MITKNFLKVAPLAILMAIAIPANSSIIVPGTPAASSSAKTEDPRARQLVQRLEDIRDVNKSELTGSEKKDLRKEVRGIKREMKTIKGGVYLSAGAIIIVILLLILLM